MNGVETDTSLEPLRVKSRLQGQPFTSTVPLFGRIIVWLRTTWNNVAARWYVDSLIQQQNEFNRLIVQQLEETNARLADFDTRLGDQDHDQSALIHDIAELSAHLALLNQMLEQLEERLASQEAKLAAADQKS